MIFTEITVSYPYVQHKVEISHLTARKSTAIEWVILEAIRKCEELPNYLEVSIASFFEQIFTISDADLLIRPCLISLQDIGAITISGIDDETELNTVAMRNLKLTSAGRNMQVQGLLPGVTSEEICTIYYDIVADALSEDAKMYNDEPTGMCVMDLVDAEETNFPEGAIRDWLQGIKNDKKSKKLHWLSPTTSIESVTSLSSNLLWKNISKKVELVDGMRWTISGEEDSTFDEMTLEKTDLSYSDKFKSLPYLELSNPDEEIQEIVSISKINELIKKYLEEDDFFCIEETYYEKVNSNKKNKKNKKNKEKRKIGIVFDAKAFQVECKGKQMLIRVPDTEMRKVGLYMNSHDSIQAGIVPVTAGKISKEIAVAYVPKKSYTNLANTVVSLVDKYYEKDYSLVFVLYELGLKELFLEYVERMIAKEISIEAKAEVIERLNQKSIECYNQKIISALDKERLLVNKAYIISKCKSIDCAKELITEFAAINAFKQDEPLFQRILRLIMENLSEQDSLEDIWSLWDTIADSKKSYINWLAKTDLQKNVYSKKSIQAFLDRFTDEDIFEIEEYSPVEQIILNMRRISLQLEDMLPDFNLYQSVSLEMYNEIVLAHRDRLHDLYDLVRQWKDEEEKCNSKVMDFDEVLDMDSSLFYVKRNIDGFRNALATFFDDSFMRFKKVYIVDTCTLLNEPALISWFEDGKALLVIPMVVLDELDNLKNSEEEEKALRAREVIRNISNYRAFAWLNTGESSHTELLPADLDKERNDNKILSIAIRYCAKNPVLLTDDINLGNIASANNIDNMTLDLYEEMKIHEKLTNQSSGKKSKKKKKK